MERTDVNSKLAVPVFESAFEDGEPAVIGNAVIGSAVIENAATDSAATDSAVIESAATSSVTDGVKVDGPDTTKRDSPNHPGSGQREIDTRKSL